MNRKRQRSEPIDWDRVRQRLATATAATAGRLQLSPEASERILQERARILARVPASAAPAGQSLEVATFALGREQYAIETRHLREVVRGSELTTVPGAPAFVLGLLNLRGDILAVFDLKPFLGVADSSATESARILVLGGNHAEFGIRADAARQVVTLCREDVLEPPAALTGTKGTWVRGVTRDALILLDGAALLADSRLFVDQSEEASPSGRGHV